jgi:hypothetical protein
MSAALYFLIGAAVGCATVRCLELWTMMDDGGAMEKMVIGCAAVLACLLPARTYYEDTAPACAAEEGTAAVPAQGNGTWTVRGVRRQTRQRTVAAVAPASATAPDAGTESRTAPGEALGTELQASAQTPTETETETETGTETDAETETETETDTTAGAGTEEGARTTGWGGQAPHSYFE